MLKRFSSFFSLKKYYLEKTGDRRKKNSVYRPGGREVEIRSIKIFRRVGEQIRFGKKNVIIINIYVFSGVATAARIHRMHGLINY